MKNWISLLTVLFCVTIFAQQTTFKFDFGGSRVENGFIPINSTSKFDKKIGYGFMDISGSKSVDNGGNALTGDFITSDKPFYFSVEIPEGNYNFTFKEIYFKKL